MTTTFPLLHHQVLNASTEHSGTPLLLLHGLFGSADNWGSIARYFAQKGPVISVDLRNHGRSPHHESQTYAEMAADVLAVCDHLNLEELHVLGHSLGGKVAMQFAMQWPQRVSKLIVVDMAMRAYADVHTPLIDAMLAVDLHQCASRGDVDKALAPAIPNLMVRQFLLTNLHKVDDRLQWRLNLAALKANYGQLQSALLPPVATGLTMPSLFIRGERSDYVNAQDIHTISQHFTQAHFVSLPTDHWVHAEQPQLFMQTVEAFLAE